MHLESLEDEVSESYGLGVDMKGRSAGLNDSVGSGISSSEKLS